MEAADKAMQEVLELAGPLARSMNLEVLLAEEVSAGGRRTLRIYLDKPEGGDRVTIEDCEKFSRALDPILDVEVGLRGKYNLEISSPGLDRPLVQEKHFRAHLGGIVHVTTRGEIEGRHKFKGELKEVKEEGGGAILIIREDQREFAVPLGQVKRAHLDYFETEEFHKASKKVPKFKER
jgi:ribosome maturation factor RimP